MKVVKKAVICALQAFVYEIKYWFQKRVFEELNERTIDLGDFLKKSSSELFLKELTFIPGGSGLLDYAFLKCLATVFSCKTYLEIGTYIGESINILTDCCDRLYSITAPPDSDFSMHKWCKIKDIPDYSERLAYNNKITHFYCDSKEFDFNIVSDEIDLFFIDGNHTYSGVYSDTKKVFDFKTKNSIVVWHDFKSSINRYERDVVKAVKDAIGNEFKNVYVTNNNMCGIYIPDDIINNFSVRKNCFAEDAPLFTYDIKIQVITIK